MAEDSMNKHHIFRQHGWRLWRIDNFSPLTRLGSEVLGYFIDKLPLLNARCIAFVRPLLGEQLATKQWTREGYSYHGHSQAECKS